jgi:splicing factor 1
MISCARRKVVTGLLLMTMALLASGCASDGSSSGTASVGVYGYGGYYGGYPGYYGGNVVVGAPMPPPAGVHPPGGAPPHASQLPSRPMPAPAPRPMPAARGGGGRR